MSATEIAIVPPAEWGEARGRAAVEQRAGGPVPVADRAQGSDSAAIGRPGAKNDERARVRLPTGTSFAIRGVIGLIRQVAEHESTVLILGESGTGKEVVARAVHDLSPRRQRPFVAVNCGAIPAELLESELFGHERGAFTGAVAARKGRFEIAEGGTLFLDEIGDMSPTMQVKLLRVLQERVFERVGNHVPIRCNVRIIAATHRNLEDAIAHSTFREDLFHRLNVFPVEMPPLRERIEDLPLLVRDFIAHNVAEGRGHVELSPRALAALALHRWPGNVRELANLIERLSIVCSGRMTDIGRLPAKYRPSDWTPEPEADAGEAPGMAAGEEAPRFLEGLATAGTEPLADEESAGPHALAGAGTALDPSSGREGAGDGVGPRTGLGAQEAAAASDRALLPASGLDLRAHLAAIERRLIEQALERSGGTVAHAARLLNLRRTTLVEKMRKLGMSDTVTED
jgi:sigma-54 dependent transcriptional regulator, flagellar regulatory protein